MNEPRRIHDVLPREHLDRWVFFLILAGGAAGIVLMKLLDAPAAWVISYAAAVLAFYACLTHFSGRLRVEPETIGDNCYYLGFLFTLVSLAYTLYKVGAITDGGDPSVNIPEVISGFGVALSSTIFGVGLRIIMMQFRVDFYAKDREVRAELEKTTGEFRRTLSDALSRMKSFAAESVQLAAERDDRIRKSSENLLYDHQSELQSYSEAFSSRVEDLVGAAMKNLIEEIGAALVQNQTTFHEQMERMLEQARTTRERLQQDEGRAFDEMTTRRTRMIADMESIENLQKSFHGVVRDTLRDVRDVRHEMRARDAEEMAAFVEHGKRMADGLERMEGVLKGMEDMLAAHKAGVDENSRAMADVVDALANRVIPALEALEAGEARARRPADAEAAGSSDSPADFQEGRKSGFLGFWGSDNRGVG